MLNVNLCQLFELKKAEAHDLDYQGMRHNLMCILP